MNKFKNIMKCEYVGFFNLKNQYLIIHGEITSNGGKGRKQEENTVDYQGSFNCLSRVIMVIL